jgi:hypothetical protein
LPNLLSIQPTVIIVTFLGWLLILIDLAILVRYGFVKFIGALLFVNLLISILGVFVSSVDIAVLLTIMIASGIFVVLGALIGAVAESIYRFTAMPKIRIAAGISPK